jgi:predicted TIM-barrel fold metal-dependent hydrolase
MTRLRSGSSSSLCISRRFCAVFQEERYIVISADCHGGADLLEYRDYLDPRYREEFDGWASTYEAPYEDLKGEEGSRNWNSGRRLQELESDGIVGEVLFPNTDPPFSSTSSPGSQAAIADTDDFNRRWAGLKAYNRWLAEFCNQAEGRRTGVFQIMLHDIDEAVSEVHRAAGAGLRGGMLLPGAPPGSGLPPFYCHDYYGPLWRACSELGVPVNCHSGSAAPRTGDRPEDHVLLLLEMGWWDQRTLRHLVLGGVLEQNPGLRVVFTEEGTGWIPDQLQAMDNFFDSMHATAAQGELTHGAQVAGGLSLRPSEYWERQCYVGASFMHPSEATIRDQIGIDKIMWGSDYPHVEASYPYSDEAIRLSYAGLPPGEVARMLGGNAAGVFGFDLGKLRPIADRVGPRRAQVTAGIDPATLPAGAAKCPAFAGIINGSAQTRWGDNRKSQDPPG